MKGQIIQNRLVCRIEFQKVLVVSKMVDLEKMWDNKIGLCCQI